MLRQSSITDMKKADVDESEVKVTFRQYIERFLTSYYGKRIIQVSLFLSFFSCIIYVVMTYMRVNLTGADQLYPPKLAWFLYVDIAILVYYLLEYILVFLSKQHKLTYFFSFESITNVFTIVPLFFTTVTGTNFIMFMQICRIFRFLRLALFVFTFNKFGATEVSRQMIKILLTLLTLILFTATALEAIENTVREGSGKTTIHEMIYFVVVTLATVGYGDVVPESELGRVCVMTLILFTIVLIPMQTNDLIRLMGLQSYYARTLYKSNSEVPHLLVTGYVNVSALRDFSVELFHPDHGSQDKNAVILQPKDPSVEMISFLHHPQYELFLTYLRGNQMAQKDLKRGAAVQAKACVILTKKYASDSHIIDHKNILTGLAIKKYVQHCTNGKDIRLIMQLIKPESKTHFYSSLNRKSNDQLIIIEEIKMNLLAKSCFSPGIISMLSNLITSAGDATGTMNEEDKKEWMAEYTAGRGYEIYRTDLSHKFQGKKFSEVAAIVYNEFQGILFGLELDVSGQTIIRLNPGNYSIPHTMENKIHVYMICEDKKVADQVALYEMTTEEIAAYQQQKNHHKKNQKKAEKMESEDQADGESEFTSNNPNDIQQDDTELLESDYTLLPDPVNLMQVTRISIQDHSDITNHIVVCGVHPSIYYFLLPLRASYLNELQYVVILAPEPPNNEVWEGLNRFPKIIYVKGSPLSEEDLQRANINFADKAVILSRDISGAKLQLDTDDKLDAEAVFIYKAIKRCNKNVQIMIELMHSSNSEFLLPQKIKRDNQNSNFEFRHELTPLFAAGEIYISSIIDTLTSQAFYNPHIVTILQQILSGGKQSNNVIRTICELAELKQSNLWQISIPEDYLNKTFGELFNYLTVERELLPMGLYRLPGATDNHHPYVYTNPDPLTKLTHRDKVFVLAANMPNDLMSGYTQTQTSGAPGEYGGAASTNANIKIASHTNLSYEREDGRTKGQDLNRSRDMDLKRKELTRFKLEVPQTQNRYADGQQKGNKSNQLDLENLNQNSVTHFMFEQINNELASMQQEIQKIKQKVTLQNDQILEKVRSALRQEFSTLGH